jgi:hypothetical protein
VVGECVETRAWSSEVIRSWSDVLVTAALSDIDILGLRVEDGYRLKDCCRGTRTSLTAFQLDQPRGLLGALQELGIMASGIQDGSWPGVGERRRSDQS